MRTLLAITLVCGCSATVPLPDLPTEELALARCHLEAARVLPKDPEQLSVADLKDVRDRLKACSGGDAGTP